MCYPGVKIRVTTTNSRGPFTVRSRQVQPGGVGNFLARLFSGDGNQKILNLFSFLK